ncbi:MAG: thiamine-phosphate kinase [Flavobacteriales bacterium]
MFENSSKTSLEQLGEFGLIDHLAKSIEHYNKSTKLGIGDDCAVIDSGKHFTLVTTDSLVEGIHFDLLYTPLKHLGYKCIIANISDICAMNGKPEQVLVSLAVSSRFTLEAIEELYAGMNLACKKYGVDLVGGDTTSSIHGMFIGITAIGVVEKNNVVYRSGAGVHDLLCVTGDLGAPYLGLQVLEREKDVYKENSTIQPDLEGYDYVLERFLKPEARTDVIAELEKRGVIPTSMIDISDGLSSEALHLCKKSVTGCDIYLSKIPVDSETQRVAEEFNINGLTSALHSGEEYELLFTIRQEDYEKMNAFRQVTVIGHMTPDNGNVRLITNNNEAIPLEAKGWNAFDKE